MFVGDRRTQRQADTETDRQTGRDKHKHRERHTDRERCAAGHPFYPVGPAGYLKTLKINARRDNPMVPMENGNCSKNEGANRAADVTELSLTFRNKCIQGSL